MQNESKTAPKKFAFDPECGDLAKYFLPEGASDQAINCLAQAIQDTVEAFFEDNDAEGNLGL